MIFTVLAFLLALGLLVFIHELGHYSVARYFGVRVLRFSVGFGRVLFKRTDRHGTEWAVSMLPLGGYVKMQDDPPPGASATEVAASFNHKPVGQRFAVVAAGPIFNLILAVLLYAGLNIAGTQEPAAVLAQPSPGTAAEQAGIQRADRIIEVDGREVASWNEARWRLLDVSTGGGRASLTLLRDERRMPAELILAASGEAGMQDPLAHAGLALSLPRPTVRSVLAGSAGERDGLRQGDLITRAADVEHPDTRALIDTIQGHGGKPLPLTVERDGAVVGLTVTPALETIEGRAVGRLGVHLAGDLERVTVRHGVLDSAWLGVQRTVETAWFSLKMMGRMVIGDVSWRNISGPVTIADYAGQTARIGLAAYIAYLALISISLGVLNLLPIPMLDGGHLLYYSIEIVRGKPVSERWVAMGQRVGLSLLATLMALAFFNDFTRLLG